jgi:hypothetical protein
VAWTLERGGVRSREREPSSEADLTRGGRFVGPLWWAAGASWRELCCARMFCVRFGVCLCFVFFSGFKQDPPPF